METSQRNILISKIKQLSNKRQYHQKIIYKLLNQQLPTSSSIQQFRSNISSQQKNILLVNESNNKQGYMKQNRKVQMIKPIKHIKNIKNIEYIQNVPPRQLAQQTSRSTSSKFSISHQVNLDTYLYNNIQQTENLNSSHLSNNSYINNNIKTKNKLFQSLKQQYNQCIITIKPNKKLNNIDMIVTDKFVDFSIIVQYLNNKDLWEDIFMLHNNQFYASICQQFYLEKHKQNMQGIICLSTLQLQKEEKDIIISMNNFNINQSLNNSQEGQHQIFIGYLLLYRLLSYLNTGSAPQIIQYLMGYPYTIYRLHDTISYLRLQKLIHSTISQQIIILGQKGHNNSIQSLKVQKLLAFSPQQLLQKYNKIIIIKQIQQICIKKLMITHHRGHYAVVDLQNIQNKQKQFWVTFVAKQNYNLFSNITRPHQNKTSYGFQYSLIGQQGQIITYSHIFQPNKQGFNLKMASLSQYKLYISYFPNQQNQNNIQLLSFNIILHSNTELSSIKLSLKLYPTYNRMSQTLINRYLSQNKNLDQVQKQLIRLSNMYPQTNIIIVRGRLKLMGLGIDFICVQNNQVNLNNYKMKGYVENNYVNLNKYKMKGYVENNQVNLNNYKMKGYVENNQVNLNKYKMKEQIEIQYEDDNVNGGGVMCDRYYKKNKIKLKNIKQIQQIYLRKLVKIKSCSGLSYQIVELFL